MTDASRMAKIDEQLLLAAEDWMRAEARERSIARTIVENQTKNEHRGHRGDLDRMNSAGDAVREQIRAAERHAKEAQDQALKIRREILGPVRRGAGAKEPVAEPVRARDPATQMLIDKRNAEKAAREDAKAAREAKRLEEAITLHDIDHMSMNDD